MYTKLLGITYEKIRDNHGQQKLQWGHQRRAQWPRILWLIVRVRVRVSLLESIHYTPKPAMDTMTVLAKRRL